MSVFKKFYDKDCCYHQMLVMAVGVQDKICIMNKQCLTLLLLIRF